MSYSSKYGPSAYNPNESDLLKNLQSFSDQEVELSNDPSFKTIMINGISYEMIQPGMIGSKIANQVIVTNIFTDNFSEINSSSL